MNHNELFNTVLAHEVKPALGCTEPGAVAYAAAIAAQVLRLSGQKEVQKIVVTVDPRVYKNGHSVYIPWTEGKGNALAAVLGTIAGNPRLGLESLKEITGPDVILASRIMAETNSVNLSCLWEKGAMYIQVDLHSAWWKSSVIIEQSHTNVTQVSLNDEEVDSTILKDLLPQETVLLNKSSSSDLEYKDVLKNLSIAELIEIARNITNENREYIDHGIRMNLAIAEVWKNQEHGVSKAIQLMKDQGIYEDSLATDIRLMVSAATDARMFGAKLPAMSSGASGNQGFVATLVPYMYAQWAKIDEKILQESIALSHLLNAYCKTFTGGLVPVCGCSVAAGVGATAAIAYQATNGDYKVVSQAINNLAADIAGMVCDGAKGGCSLKVATAATAALQSAVMAINGNDIAQSDGLVGKTPEETIRNLGRFATEGMKPADTVILDIMQGKG